MSRIAVIACGNPLRGDDALGPAFAAEAAALVARAAHNVELQTDFQLSPEHTLDVVGRDAVLFVDACIDAPGPFRFSVVRPARDHTFTSHAMSPAALLAAHGDALGPAPPAFALAIRGSRFELGASMTAEASRHLAAALRFFERLLADADPRAWYDRARPCCEPA
jgi:hydrogenase maturation protease